MADGEEARELSVKIPALRVEIRTRDLQCQECVLLSLDVRWLWLMHWKDIVQSQLVVEQQMQNQRILFSKMKMDYLTALLQRRIKWAPGN